MTWNLGSLMNTNQGVRIYYKCGVLKTGFQGCSDFRMSGPTGLGFNLCVAPAL